ncbi:MAG: PP2C family protein-serine/threonine phosphatase [Planctomycetes bacterium]|nr:PP2C family protein-serine/threonine phosphatase [Planctomycetota bacterium]
MRGDVEREVAQRLRDDPRWRVMVRSNNWVCPYCLKLGVRDLQLDEALEERIAGHLVSECQTWNQGAGVPGDVDRVRQAAQYVVFKIRILGYMREDARFRLRAADGRWLCPYCAQGANFRPLQASLEPDFLEELNEDHELLSRVVDHLLRCQVFAQGEDKLRPRAELRQLTQGSQAARRHDPAKVAGWFKTDPSFRLMDPDRRWLCPFCARVLELKVPEGSGRTAFFEGVAAHLERCKAYTVLEGQPRPVSELRSKIEEGAHARQVEKLKRKIMRHPLWRVRDLETNWLCPYCARVTAARFPQKRADGTFEEGPAQRFYAGVLEHLSGCADYKSKSPIRSREDMAAAVQAENVQLDRHRRVRKWLLDDPAYGVTDAVSNWVCPHCRRRQKAITIGASIESATFEKTVEQVVAHLWSACESFDEDRPPQGSPADLKQEVIEESLLKSGDSHSNAAKVFKPQESLDEVAWERLKNDLDAVQRRVARAREQDKSLIEARQKQLRLLSEVPQVPGLEFARVYEPCDAVGGDFYSFFRPSERHHAMVIGDITGHGIEAALLMGLAKKLVEVHGREAPNQGRVPSTQQTLCLANRDIFSDLDDKTFVTVFYGLLDVESRRFVFSRAGHNPVILYNTKREPPLQVLDSKGMALGMDEGQIFEASLEEVAVTLLPGDLVLQYTDGVTEALNPRNEQFGDERLHQVVERFGRYEAEYLLWRILRAVEAFREGRRSTDDVTLVAFKVES